MTPPAPQTSSRASPNPLGFFGIGRAFARERGNFTWVYLWGAPIRAMHWIAAVCIVALVISGFYIGRPYFMTAGEASAHYAMGWMRFVHFLGAALLVMTGIVRAYWLLAGNQFERYPALLPASTRAIRNIIKTGLAYATFRPDRQPNFVGHNPLQQLAYTGTYVMAVIMVVTGFVLYGQSNPDGVIYAVFHWFALPVGGLQNVRLIHHAMTYGFIIFVIMHVYFAVRSDYVERAGVVSSIITGGRYINADENYEDFDIAKVPSRPWPTNEYPVPEKK